MQLSKKDFYEFGPFRLDVAQRLLLRGGETVPLTPKTFDLLLVLVESGGKVVDKDALMQRVWPDTFVEEGNLTKNVFLLRKALGEGHVETVPKRGYRFSATLREAPALDEVSVEEQTYQRVTYEASDGTSRRKLIGAAGGVVTVMALAAGLTLTRSKPAPEVRSLVILPFRMTGPAIDSYLAEGITDELTTRLARIRSLRVISSQVALRYKDPAADPRAVGRQLGVDGVLMGSLHADGERLRMSAQLMATQDGSVVWADNGFDEPRRDLFEAGQRLASAVVSRLQVRLTSEERRALGRRGTPNPEAYESFLQGKARLVEFVRKEDRAELDQARRSFKNALRLDAAYADAHAGMAMALYSGIAAQVAPRADLGAASAEAETALRIDPDQILARRALIEIYYFTGEARDGLIHAKRLLEIDSHDPAALGSAGRAYFQAGMLDKAVPLMEEAVRLDPADEANRHMLGFTCLFSKDFVKGLDALRPVVKFRRDLWLTMILYKDMGDLVKAREYADRHRAVLRRASGYYFTGVVYEALGQPDQAREVWLEGVKNVETGLGLFENANARRHLAMMYGKLGREKEAREQIRMALVEAPRDPLGYFFAAETSALLARREDALHFLRSAMERDFLALYFADYYLERPLHGLYRYRNDPEFRGFRAELARKVDGLRKIY